METDDVHVGGTACHGAPGILCTNFGKLMMNAMIEYRPVCLSQQYGELHTGMQIMHDSDIRQRVI